MGIADRIYELVKDLPEPEASKILQFAESVRGRRATVISAQRYVDLTVFRQYRGSYNGVKIKRETLYDRAGLR